MKRSKIMSLILPLSILALTILVLALMIPVGQAASSDITNDLSPKLKREAVDKVAAMSGTVGTVWISAILPILALIGVLGFWVFHLIRNPKKSLVTLAWIGGIGLVLLIAKMASPELIMYGMINGEPNQALNTVSEGKWTNGMLITLIIMAVVAFLALVLSEVRGAFRSSSRI